MRIEDGGTPYIVSFSVSLFLEPFCVRFFASRLELETSQSRGGKWLPCWCRNSSILVLRLGIPTLLTLDIPWRWIVHRLCRGNRERDERSERN